MYQHESMMPRAPKHSPTPAQLEAFSTLIDRLGVYIICMTAVLTWDILVTLRAEIVYVWPSRWTLIKFCFLLNRYLTLLFMVFLSVCTFSERVVRVCGRIHLIQPLIPVVIYLCCNYKLIRRCSALFADHRPVLSCLLLLCVAQAGVQVFCSLKNRPLPLPPGVTGCFSNPSFRNSRYGLLYWVMPLAVQAIILLITLVKILRDWRVNGHSQVLRRFVQDGVLYFVVVASANLVNIAYMKSKVQIHGVQFHGGNFNAAMTLVVTSTMVSRLIIHMRKKSCHTSANL